MILRRQTETGGAASAGSSQRLDPHALPVRYTASDAVADGRVRHIEIDHRQVRLRRMVRGMTINFAVKLDTYLGVAMRLIPAENDGEDSVVIRLEHRDPALSLPLFSAPDNSDVVAEWQLWASALGLPLLIADLNGTLRSPYPTLGGVRVGEPGLRRRRRNAIKRRRGALPLRRRTGVPAAEPQVHKEREIIARS